MEVKMRQVAKCLIYNISQKFNILAECKIMKRFNGAYIDNTGLYVNMNCRTYIKEVLDRHVLSGLSKK